jgi:transcriptional regulator with XRE-family HTH domain
MKVPALRAAREANTLSQAELAERSNVDKSTIVRLEAGGDAQPRTIRKLAEALAVTPDQLKGEG